MACWRETRGLPACEGREMTLLDTPDIRQDADGYDCGAVATDVAAAIVGIRRRGPSKLANAVQGMSPDTVAAWFRAVGCPVLDGTMTVDDLRHFTRLGRPVLCCVKLHGGHWVVVRGVARGRVYFHDPIDGRSSVPVATWDAIWSDETVKGRPFVRWGICPIPPG